VSGSAILGFHEFYANAATRFVLDADSSHGLGNGSVVQLWQNLGDALRRLVARGY